MSSLPTRRRRRWLVALPLIVVLALAAVWSGFWFYAAAQAEDVLAAWHAREGQAGRNYACGRQTIGGFPFRFEVACDEATADFSSNDPKVAFQAARFQVAAQVYDPTLLIAEIGAPLSIEIAGDGPLQATWTLLQVSLRGRPPTPDRVSMAVDDAAVTPQGAAGEALLRAKRIELHVRVASGAVNNRPVLDLAATLIEVAAPTLHPLTREPLDVTATGVLRGFDNLRPMPLPARLSQLQAAGGRLEIKHARFRQGEVIAVATGSLGLSRQGRLDGTVNLIVAGLERVLPQLGIDQLAPQNDKLAPALSALDRLVPGLGRVARDQAGAGLAIGLTLLGKPAELEGRKALALPLRFVDGAVFLGPLRLGAIGPLF